MFHSDRATHLDHRGDSAPSVGRTFLSATSRCTQRLVMLTVYTALMLLSGCMVRERPPKAHLPPSKYPVLAQKNLPAFMKGTILEVAEVENKDPYLVSGYGLVVGLANTGDNRGTPQAVVNAMLDEMTRRRLGSSDDRLKHFKPEAMLNDPQTAIVEVYAYLPPGGRAGQRIDVFVQAVRNSQTKSLARGNLYQTNLFVGGADPLNPRPKPNVYVKAAGAVFVNPAYASEGNKFADAASLRTGTIMSGGVMTDDRPLSLRARTPQLSIARSIEMRLDLRFEERQANPIAKTQDEAIVHVYVPRSFNGDWEHFVGVATHLYLDATPGAGVIKARMLAAEAIKPDAPLMDISYCWEGIGDESLSVIQKLYTNASPEVAFAAARAGAFIGDSSADETIQEIARNDANPFQLNAVKVLGALPASPRVDRMLTELLATKNALVRVEAYRVLAEHEANAVISRPINGQFTVDLVATDGPPLVYASRTGIPRIAVFGTNISLNQPIMYNAMDDRLTICTDSDGKSVTVFDRTDKLHPGGLQAKLRPDLYEVIWRLAGGNDDGFRFCYSDLVGILQGLSHGKHISAAFVLQDAP
ncbi:MAG TPA: flagellar basal body P-ring protein FlgI, partial [Tepidisphaeraceae bacterium]|nr:flagellar basal body P-ring protein FlgI [Tepidisphaeraceae bacterium]